MGKGISSRLCLALVWDDSILELVSFCGSYIYFGREETIYNKSYAECGRAPGFGIQDWDTMTGRRRGWASWPDREDSRPGGLRAMARGCLFRSHFVILSRKPENRPREGPTEPDMHMDLVGGDETEGREGGPGPG